MLKCIKSKKNRHSCRSRRFFFYLLFTYLERLYESIDDFGTRYGDLGIGLFFLAPAKRPLLIWFLTVSSLTPRIPAASVTVYHFSFPIPSKKYQILQNVNPQLNHPPYKRKKGGNRGNQIPPTAQEGGNKKKYSKKRMEGKRKGDHSTAKAANMRLWLLTKRPLSLS